MNPEFLENKRRCDLMHQRQFTNSFIMTTYFILCVIDVIKTFQPSTGLYRYVFTQSLRQEQDLTQGQFLSKIQTVWIPNFLSLGPIAEPRLKNPVYPTIYPSLRREHIDSYLSVWSETHSASSRIWTRVSDSISNENNYYCKCAFVAILFVSCFMAYQSL